MVAKLQNFHENNKKMEGNIHFLVYWDNVYICLMRQLPDTKTSVIRYESYLQQKFGTVSSASTRPFIAPSQKHRPLWNTTFKGTFPPALVYDANAGAKLHVFF